MGQQNSIEGKACTLNKVETENNTRKSVEVMINKKLYPSRGQVETNVNEVRPPVVHCYSNKIPAVKSYDVRMVTNEKSASGNGTRAVEMHSSVTSARKETQTTSASCQNTTQTGSLNQGNVNKSTERRVEDKKSSPPVNVERSHGRRNFTEHRLFVGGLPEELTEAELKAIFENYGKVTDVNIQLEKGTNKSKRFGFVGFKEENSVKVCLEEHFVMVKGKRVEVKKAWPRRSENDQRKNEEGKAEQFFGKENFATDSKAKTGGNSVDYQKLFDDYFKAKFAVQNMLGSEVHLGAKSSEEIPKEESANSKDMEKLLESLFISMTEKSSAGDLSSDSEETDSESDFSCSGSSTGKSKFQNNGRLICAVCEWAPRDDSIEAFLAHCNTIDHKLKLKERFQESDEKTSVKNNPTHESYRRKRNARNKSASRVQSEKKNDKEMPKKTSHNRKSLKCEMCNKKINYSQDPRTFISNLTQHLQSKKHLMNLQSDLVQDKLGRVTDVKEKNTATVKLRKNERNFEGSKTNPEVKPCQSINDILKNSKTLSFNDLNSITEEKVTFRCLPCDFYCSRPKTFLTHAYCEAHLTTFKEKSFAGLDADCLSIEDCCKTLVHCQNCGRHLFGSSLDIKKHFMQCK